MDKWVMWGLDKRGGGDAHTNCLSGLKIVVRYVGGWHGAATWESSIFRQLYFAGICICAKLCTLSASKMFLPTLFCNV